MSNSNSTGGKASLPSDTHASTVSSDSASSIIRSSWGNIFVFWAKKQKTEKFNSYILIFKIKETLTNKTTHVCFKNWYNFNNLPRNFARNYQFQQQIY